MERNEAKPFFIYYPMILGHEPFQPTPDDGDFASWNAVKGGDTIYYPSMIKYMDKKIGQIINKVKELGIENNTIIIYTGDNGTPADISQYIDDDSVIVGGKATTTEFGTHVPLIVYWPGTVAAGSVNNDLIDFTDFLPTLANIANIATPTDYGPLDGVSFAPQITENTGTPRDWLFYHYNPHPEGTNSVTNRWAQTEVYKLYDTSVYKSKRLFYNIVKDINQKSPIADASLTPTEVTIKQQLLDIINSYVAQGAPLFANLTFNALTDSTVTLNDSILINGGSTITASGFVYDTNPNPTISSPHTTNKIFIGAFSNTITGLKAGQTYYVRAYAVNYAGTSYSSQISFKTFLHIPVATAATLIDSNKFTAHWNAVNGNSSYKFDVSKYPLFATTTPLKLSEGFNNGITPPAGWTFNGNIISNSSTYGQMAPSIVFNAKGAQIITKPLGGIATQLKFWIKNLNSSVSGALLVEGFNGSTWVTVKNMTMVSGAASVKTFNATSNPPLPVNISQFRFTSTKSVAILAFDDVSINYNQLSPSFVSGFNNLTVQSTSKLVTGLKTGTSYYYRVRAFDGTNSSANSNVITTSTCKKPVITNLNINNITCNGNNDGSISVTDTGSVGTLAYSWTNNNNFSSSEKNITGLTAGTYKLRITANGGCAADTSVVITESLPLNASASADAFTCAGGTTTLTVTATGGTGNYHYTLSDGTNTTGPQDDNHFTVAAGSYTVIVEDDNHCSFTTSPVEVIEPPAIGASASADAITCTGGTTTLTVTATGGTGNYRYTLSDGTNTTGPQDDNHFTVAAGNYTVIVEDDNHCSFTTSPVEVNEPAAIGVSASADAITCAGGTTTLTVTATGGTGNYHYTLSDGTNTTGPQDDNHFTVTAGNYTITVMDDNSCSYYTSITIDDGTEVCNEIASINNKNSSNIKLVTKNTELKVDVFPNPASDEFSLKIQSNSDEKIKLVVIDEYGRNIYQRSGIGNNERYWFGKQFSSGVYFIKIIQGKNFKTLKLIKEK